MKRQVKDKKGMMIVRDRTTDKSIMDFVKLSIENPEILNDSEKAKDIAYNILKNNQEEDKEKDKTKA